VHVQVAAGNGWAELRVSDAGPGPAHADRAQVFDRFWRAPSAAGRPGAGLGLAIVESIAHRHGGTVTVEGSTFTLRLPADPPGDQPAPA
jgi:signal transduction histidine kinase